MNNVKEFLKEYNELTERHGIYIGAGVRQDSFKMPWSFITLNVEKNGEIFKKIPIRWSHEKNKWEKGKVE